MGEYLLGEAEWPASLGEPQRTRLRSIVAGLRRVPEILGVAAGGSFVSARMDEYSDLDLVVVAAPAALREIPPRRQQIASSLGPLLAAFTGEHVGEPRLLICLYGPPLVHADLKFVAPEELAERVEDPVVLWDRQGDVQRGLSLGVAAFPRLDRQWIEDRFWVWVHYAATKIGRGELFEAADFLAFLRARVLGPLALEEASTPPSGVRRIEQAAPGRVGPLRETVAGYDARDILRATRAAIAMYRAFRERSSPPDLARRADAESAAESYLDSVARRLEALGSMAPDGSELRGGRSIP